MPANTSYKYTPVPFTDVTIDDHFWSPRITTNREVTIPYDFQKCEETDRITNFDKAAGWLATISAFSSTTPMSIKSSKAPPIRSICIPTTNLTAI